MAPLVHTTLIIILLTLTRSVSGWITSYPYIQADFTICHREQPDVVMWVQGRATSRTHRAVIREMMANKKVWPSNLKIVALFFVGTHPDPEVQHLLEYEFEAYNDIVQNDYLEHYRNQTAKMMSAINFIADYCNHTKISLRIDDDVIFHPAYLMNSVINYINRKNRLTYDPKSKYHANVLGDKTEQRPVTPPVMAAPSETETGSANHTEVEDDLHYRELFTEEEKEDNSYGRQHERVHNANFTYYSTYELDNRSSWRKVLRQLKNNTIVCHILHHKIGRNKNVYALDKKFLPGEVWLPDYCAGFLIAFTTDVLISVQKMFVLEPPFWIDDAYLGVIQKRIRTINAPANRQMKFAPNKKGNLRRDLQKKTPLSPVVIHLNQRGFYRELGKSNLLTQW